MAIINTSGDQFGYKGNAYAGCVVRHEEYSYHVPSDNAMIDSGVGLRAVVWDENYMSVRDLAIGGGRGGEWPDVTDDLTHENAIKVNRWREVNGWVSSVLHAANDHTHAKWNAEKIVKGDTVQVFKGRKVPKGTYYVHIVGNGQYGTYVHLSTERNGMGDYYRFVSQDNINKVVENKPLVVPQPPFGNVSNDCLRLVLTCATASYSQFSTDPNHWAVLADCLEEEGFESQAEVVRWRIRAIEAQKEEWAPKKAQTA